jgi:hypothetical protein
MRTYKYYEIKYPSGKKENYRILEVFDTITGYLYYWVQYRNTRIGISYWDKYLMPHGDGGYWKAEFKTIEEARHYIECALSMEKIKNYKNTIIKTVS